MGVLDQIKAKKAQPLASSIAAPEPPKPNPPNAVTATVTAGSTPAPTSALVNAPEPNGKENGSGGLKSILMRDVAKGGSSLSAAIAGARQSITPSSPPAGPVKPIPKPPTDLPVTQVMTPVTEEKAAAFKAEAETLKANIAFLKSHMNDVPLIKDVVVTVFKQVKATPDLNIVMEEGDYEVTMEAYKRAYVWAARMRTEKRDTRAKKNAQSDDFARSLKDSGFVIE